MKEENLCKFVCNRNINFVCFTVWRQITIWVKSSCMMCQSLCTRHKMLDLNVCLIQWTFTSASMLITCEGNAEQYAPEIFWLSLACWSWNRTKPWRNKNRSSCRTVGIPTITVTYICLKFFCFLCLELLCDCAELCKCCRLTDCVYSQCESGDYGFSVQSTPEKWGDFCLVFF